MNEKQQSWTKTQCSILKSYLESVPVLSEQVAESVDGYISVVSKVAKGCESEVRSALFDVVEPYQYKAEEMMRNERT